MELLEPALGSKPGDRIIVEGDKGEADSVLNSKKNPWDVISTHLKVNSHSVAIYKNLELKTSAGTIKAHSAKDIPIH